MNSTREPCCVVIRHSNKEEKNSKQFSLTKEKDDCWQQSPFIAIESCWKPFKGIIIFKKTSRNGTPLNSSVTIYWQLGKTFNFLLGLRGLITIPTRYTCTSTLSNWLVVRTARDVPNAIKSSQPLCASFLP